MGGGHAHYVILDRDGPRVWSRDRGAHSLLGDLLNGPERTVAFIRDQRGGTPDFWMNAVWWTGFALLDLRRRLLLVHTVEDIPGYEPGTSVLEIRAWLELAENAWPRWRVAWATRGLYEVMDRLGLPYDTVRYLDDPLSLPAGQWASAPVDDDDPSTVAGTVIAVRDATGRLSFGGWWGGCLAEPLMAGPAPLLTPQDEATPCAVLAAVPRGGALLDARERRLDWWSVDCPMDLRRLDDAWRGWTLTDHGDAFEEVAALTGPDLLLESAPREEVLRRVRAALGVRAP
ncbi:hypothetical protein [Actinomadura kijaniata]|uniref:hypothetical protein n=1 Tax=Actinomadura kijaniata TaxID=46161 RepID=UPI000A77645C|nr:hypothetical protein [Actinomadura kijaniata]